MLQNSNLNSNKQLMVPQRSAIPLPPLLLGLAGLIPFIFLPVWILYQGPTGLLSLEALKVLRSYAALILSFMGAIHWGFELARPSEIKQVKTEQNQHQGPCSKISSSVLFASVSYCLFGWLSLQFQSSMWSFYALAGAFLILYFYDLSRREHALAMPAWYCRLRLPLTCVVVVSLLVSANL